MKRSERKDRRLRFSMRTLLFVMLLGGPFAAYVWQGYQAWREHVALKAEAKQRLATANIPVGIGLTRLNERKFEENWEVTSEGSRTIYLSERKTK